MAMEEHEILLKAGMQAPDFRLQDQDGQWHSLQDYAGKQLVIVFYSEDGSPTCTKQACHLRDNLHLLTGAGYTVVGVSPDSVKSHQKFMQKQGLNYPLLADEAKEMINAYGVWGQKTTFGRTYDGVHRTTFLIGPDGVIKDVIVKVESGRHVKQILAAGG